MGKINVKKRERETQPGRIRGREGGERGTGLRRKGPHFPKSTLSPQEIAECLGVSSSGVRGGGVPWRIECATF